jgi:serine/threonine protein kinase
MSTNKINRSIDETPREYPLYKIGDCIAGQYQIQQIHGGEGKSGMGVLYICYDSDSKRFVALKTFQDKYLESTRMKDNFRKEALLWISLEAHPYIVRAYWVQELEHRMFISCEYIAADHKGRNNLSHYLGSPVSLQQVLAWSIQFCHGIDSFNIY